MRILLYYLWAIQKFRAYLEDYHFTVVTDCGSLRWLHNLRNPTGRLARWALSLLEYDFEIIYHKGPSHLVPDALSRMFEPLPLETFNLTSDLTPAWYSEDIWRSPTFRKNFPHGKFRTGSYIITTPTRFWKA